MEKPEAKNVLERFFDTLDGEEQELLSAYLQKKIYDSLSESFDKLLKRL